MADVINWTTKDVYKGEKLERAKKQGKQANERVSFKGFRQFNCEEGRKMVGLKRRLSLQPGYERSVQKWFSGDKMTDRLARALAKREAIDCKEFVESFEFFSHCRAKRHGLSQSSIILDLCCGHGFVALLFAIFEKAVQVVVLLDRKRPDCFDKILAACVEVAPWVEQKLLLKFGEEFDIAQLATQPEYLEAVVRESRQAVATTEQGAPPTVGVLAVHACGHVTDMCIDIGVQLAAPMGLMPCCYRPPRNDLEKPANEHENSSGRGRGSGSGSGSRRGTQRTRKRKGKSNESEVKDVSLAPASRPLQQQKQYKQQKQQQTHHKDGRSRPKHGQDGQLWGNVIVPETVEQHLGRGMSIDVYRSFRLHASGYSVEWAVGHSLGGDAQEQDHHGGADGWPEYKCKCKHIRDFPHFKFKFKFKFKLKFKCEPSQTQQGPISDFRSICDYGSRSTKHIIAAKLKFKSANAVLRWFLKKSPCAVSVRVSVSAKVGCLFFFGKRTQGTSCLRSALSSV